MIACNEHSYKASDKFEIWSDPTKDAELAAIERLKSPVITMGGMV